MPFISTALAVGIGAAGVGSSIYGAKKASQAANTQAEAADKGYALSAKAQADSLAENKRQFDIGQQNLAPFLQTGTDATHYLDQNMDQLTKPYGEQFHAPTLDEAKANPGYQFALDTGTQALASRAAAQGTLLSGQTGEALTAFGQRLGETNYNDTFNRMLTEHTNAFNEYNVNQSNTYNRYANLAGAGQTTATQLADLGQRSATNAANINLNSTQNQQQALNNAAAARGSGYVGSANAYANIPGQVAGALTLQQLLAQNNKNVPPGFITPQDSDPTRYAL